MRYKYQEYAPMCLKCQNCGKTIFFMGSHGIRVKCSDCNKYMVDMSELSYEEVKSDREVKDGRNNQLPET